MTEDSGLSSVGAVWRLPVSEVMAVPTDEIPEWREILLEKTAAEAWVIWFVANVGQDLAIVTRTQADYSLVDCVGSD